MPNTAGMSGRVASTMAVLYHLKHTARIVKQQVLNGRLYQHLMTNFLFTGAETDTPWATFHSLWFSFTHFEQQEKQQ